MRQLGIKTTLIFQIPALLLMLSLTMSCEKEKEPKPVFTLEQPHQIPDENYELYSLWINHFYNSDKVVISQLEERHMDLFYGSYAYSEFKESFPDFDTTLVVDPLEFDNSSTYFDEQFTSEASEVILISSDEKEYYFNYDNGSYDEGWERFYNDYEYSNGIITFSKIVFSTDSTEAIFDVGQSYGSLGGHGIIVYFKKQNGGWSITGFVPTWLS